MTTTMQYEETTMLHMKTCW